MTAATPKVTPVERAETLLPLVRDNADRAEALRHLPAEVAAAFSRERLYRIGAPAVCGGESADPMMQIETIETISRADGSAGWNLMIGIESFGLIAPAFKQCLELIADPNVVMCSSTAAVGRAELCKGGYRVSGQWQFVSGCHNSQIFGATVRLYENGEQIPDTGNVYAILPLGQFEIVDTWNTSGLCGSGSHDVRVNDIVVPNERIVAPLGGYLDNSPLLRFPLGARLAYNKVAVALGIARSACDAFVALAEGKVPRFTSKTLRTRAPAQRAIAKAEVRVRAGRALLFEQVSELWDRVVAGSGVPSSQLALFQAGCSDAVAGCAEAVDLVCEAAGTTANVKGHPLERLARDARVVRQHVTVASFHMDDAGRVLLGLPAENVMLRGFGGYPSGQPGVAPTR